MRLMVIDGNSIMNRAFYGIRLLSTKDGHFTNALVGFLNIYDKLTRQAQPDGVAVAFDLHAPTFRHKMFDGYKAGRKPMPEELREQMPVIKELLGLMGCVVVEAEGYEADDILGTLSRAAAARGNECVLVTGDRDAFQLIGERVQVWLAATRHGQPETVVMDEAALREQYGLTPAQMIDLKALMGDASDRIPGVAGIGEKTALDLVQRFGSLGALYEQAENAELRPAVRKKLIEGRESAFLSRTLGTICCEVPIDADPEHYRFRPMQREALASRLASLELFRLLERWELIGAAAAPVSEPAESVSETAFVPVEQVYVAARESGQLCVWLDGERAQVLAGDAVAETAAEDEALWTPY